MAEYDGSLKFDTSLDNSGFESDSAKLLKAIDSLTKAINSTGQQMGSAFQGAGPAIKGVASAAKTGAETATAATDKYTAALDKQQAKIDALKAKMSDYYAQKAEIEKSTDEALRQAQTDEQAAHIMEIESIQLDELNQKYAKQLMELQALEAEYNRLAEAKEAAGRTAEAGGQTPESQGVGQAGDAAEQSGEKAQRSAGMWAALGSAIVATGKKALSAAGWFAKLPFQALASSVKSFTSNIKKSFSPTDKLVKSLTSLKRLLITRIKRMFITEIFNQAKESLRALALFSGDFNAAMSNIQNASKETSANLSVTIGGVIKALEPAITGLINLINSAIVAVNRLFAILGGKSTMTVAKKQTDDYAKSLSGAGGAAKDAAKQLAAFDELNILQDQQSGGGGGGGAAEDLFEEVDVDAPDFSSWGEAFDYLLDTVLGKIPALKEAFLEFDDTIRDWANNLYEMFTFPGVKEKVQQLGTELAGAFNELTANFPWSEIGHTLGAGFGLAITGLTSFIYSYNWMQLGEGIAQAVNGAVEETPWQDVGKLLWAKFKIAIETFTGFFLGLNMSDLANAATNIVLGFLDSITETIQEIPWDQVANQLWNALVAVVNDIPWTSLIESAFTLLGSAIGAAASLVGTLGARIGEVIHEAFLAAINYFSKYVSEAEALGGDWLEGVLWGIADAAKAIYSWIKEHVFQPFLDGFKSVFKIGSPSKVMEEQGGFIIEGLLQGITAAWDSITGFFEGAVDALASFLSDSWDTIKETAVTAWNNLKEGVTKKFNEAKTKLSTTANTIKTKLSATWNSVKSVASSTWENVKSSVSGKFEETKTKLGTLAGDIETALSGKWDTVKKTASEKWESVKSTVSGLMDGLKSSLENKDWTNIGANLATGIRDGISNAWHFVTGKVSTLANRLTNSVREDFDEHSPSKLWAKIGEFLSIGLAKGIEDEESSAIRSARSLANAVTGEMENQSDLSRNASAISTAVSGFSDRIADGVFALVDTLQAIADNVTFSVPEIAAGTVMPYRVAATAAPVGAGTPENYSAPLLYDNAEVIDLLEDILSAIKSGRNIYLNGKKITKNTSTDLNNAQRAGTRW